MSSELLVLKYAEKDQEFRYIGRTQHYPEPEKHASLRHDREAITSAGQGIHSREPWQ